MDKRHEGLYNLKNQVIHLLSNIFLQPSVACKFDLSFKVLLEPSGLKTFKIIRYSFVQYKSLLEARNFKFTSLQTYSFFFRI